MKLKDLIIEKSDKIQVRGLGVYPYDMLKKQVQKQVTDIAKYAKTGNWRKSSRTEFRAIAEKWKALYDYEEKQGTLK